MILVTVGASQFPFDRMLRAIDGAAFAEPLLVQHGPSPVRPRGAECVEYLPAQELAELVREASAVITHAGVGSILLARTNGKRPFVVPRLKAFGETVDDHQLETARRFDRAGVATLVEDPAGLAAAIAAQAADAVTIEAREPQLVTELRDYLAEVVR